MKSVRKSMEETGAPFILKPDVGQRGAGVKLSRNLAQAENSLRQSAAPLVVQHYAQRLAARVTSGQTH